MPATQDRKAVWGWALYDWANSAFATTVMAGFFPVFFKQFWSVGVDVNISTARLGYGNAVAGLLVAAFAPVLGAVADRGGTRKRFLASFTLLGVAATATFFWLPQGQWMGAILCYSAGLIGFSGAMIFYDALLPTVAGPDSLDRVSAFGYAAGYLGGGLLFVVNVAMTLQPHWFGLADSTAAVQWSFLTVAVWWGGFSLATFYWVPEPIVLPSPSVGNSVGQAWRQILTTLRHARDRKPLFLFLLAYWFYIDGVDTIIRMAVDYGLSLGFAAPDLITALLMVQFVGFPAALLFGRLGQYWGVKRSLFLAIGVYMLITIWGTFMQHRWEFFGIALAVGLVQGGIQALSRSYYARLIPAGRSAEFFGLYNMMGKFAAIIGPALMGTVGLAARHILLKRTPAPEAAAGIADLATRISIASVLLLFIVGAILLWRAEEHAGPDRPSKRPPST
ncbi:MAG: MFS transporter [Desulfobacteraceae bacterium]|nr:MFS transporter [Desulfobacteraceae bacterium]MBC2749451.1 MFS transporter [Desulfobacteraceae bacterium]